MCRHVRRTGIDEANGMFDFLAITAKQVSESCKNSAPSFETTYEKSGKVRRSIYRRTGKALYGHGGWKRIL